MENQAEERTRDLYYRHVARSLITALFSKHSESLKDAFNQIKLMDPREYDHLIAALADLRSKGTN